MGVARRKRVARPYQHMMTLFEFCHDVATGAYDVGFNQPALPLRFVYMNGKNNGARVNLF